MAAPAREWSLAELAEETSLPARTIRFYISRGLIPAPLKSGRGAIYGEPHWQAIQRIKRLQAKGLALAEIARELAGEAAPVTPPSPVWQYEIAPDVTVLVRAEASPWRLKQIRTALAELASRLKEEENIDE